MSEEKAQQALVSEKVDFVMNAIQESEFLMQYLAPVMKNKKKQKQFAQEMEQIYADMVMVFTLNGDAVSLADIGIFKPRIRKERPGKNPGLYQQLIKQGLSKAEANEKSKTIIPEHYQLAFEPSRKAKDEIKAHHDQV